MREVISLHGQAGVQMGNACWELYYLYHVLTERAPRERRRSPPPSSRNRGLSESPVFHLNRYEPTRTFFSIDSADECQRKLNDAPFRRGCEKKFKIGFGIKSFNHQLFFHHLFMLHMLNAEQKYMQRVGGNDDPEEIAESWIYDTS
uniref:Uncharacterized protein n=1 Tax=Panagrolaimus davidi TaxID=227884 RepID=A0A914P7V4_9BILA